MKLIIAIKNLVPEMIEQTISIIAPTPKSQVLNK